MLSTNTNTHIHPGFVAAYGRAVFTLLAFALSASAYGQDSNEQMTQQGRFFKKTSYDPAPLPTWDDLRTTLPAPIYDAEPVWIDMYWKAWEIASTNFYEPAPGSGFVSQFTDAAFNENIFLWDTAFITMFATLAEPLVPGIESLDNFYARQHATGEICREINRTTGVDYEAWINRENRPLFSRWGWNAFWEDAPKEEMAVRYRGRTAPKPNPVLTLDALNHPILAWAERESFMQTGDTERLSLVYEPLTKYFEALDLYLRQGNGLYITDWASMDNATRNRHLRNGGTAVDISAEMALFARDVAFIAAILGREEEADHYRMVAGEIAGRINRLMWNEDLAFYVDLTLEGDPVGIKSIAGFWPLLGEVARREQAELLVAELKNPDTFARLHRVPTLAASEPGYDPYGGYWNGAVWAPTNMMVIRGLERYGYDTLARESALNHLGNVGEVYRSTGTLWENYAADTVMAGDPSRPEFVGWSGIGPIRYLMEYAIGLKANAPENTLTWHLTPSVRHGCERYLFGGHVTSLIASPVDERGLMIEVESDGAYVLHLELNEATHTFQVAEGRQVFGPVKYE